MIHRMFVSLLNLHCRLAIFYKLEVHSCLDIYSIIYFKTQLLCIRGFLFNATVYAAH